MCVLVPISISLKLSVCHTVSEIFSVKNGVTLKLGVGVVQDHWKWSRSIYHTTFYWSTLYLIELSDIE